MTVSALVRGNNIILANAGDSRAIIARQSSPGSVRQSTCMPSPPHECVHATAYERTCPPAHTRTHASVRKRTSVRERARARALCTTQATLKAIDLTVDQKPDMPEEMKRIMQMGGHVTPAGRDGSPSRVWHNLRGRR